MLEGVFILLFSYSLMMVLSFDALEGGFLSSLEEGRWGCAHYSHRPPKAGKENHLVHIKHSLLPNSWGLLSREKPYGSFFLLLSRSCHKKEGLPPATLGACCLPMARRRHPGIAGVISWERRRPPGTAGVPACMYYPPAHADVFPWARRPPPGSAGVPACMYLPWAQSRAECVQEMVKCVSTPRTERVYALMQARTPAIPGKTHERSQSRAECVQEMVKCVSTPRTERVYALMQARTPAVPGKKHYLGARQGARGLVERCRPSPTPPMPGGKRLSRMDTDKHGSDSPLSAKPPFDEVEILQGGSQHHPRAQTLFPGSAGVLACM
jgi:hypothetical protein